MLLTMFAIWCWLSCVDVVLVCCCCLLELFGVFVSCRWLLLGVYVFRWCCLLIWSFACLMLVGCCLFVFETVVVVVCCGRDVFLLLCVLCCNCLLIVVVCCFCLF